jgi:transposase-like protein
MKVVKEYLSGNHSYFDLTIKYNIPSDSTIIAWVLKYNNHIELKDYDPKPEVYMKDALKTTFEERLEIVEYCLAHNRDIKGTAAKYGCKYAQLYQWVRKFEAEGKESLRDRRGKRKVEAELTELEKAERKIAQLEREKEEFRMKYELLKKAEELERW